jgi:hypothetical protein
MLGPIIRADSRLLDYMSCLFRLRDCLCSRARPQRSFQQCAELAQESGFVNDGLGSASGARRAKPRARVHGHQDDFGSGGHLGE